MGTDKLGMNLVEHLTVEMPDTYTTHHSSPPPAKPVTEELKEIRMF